MMSQISDKNRMEVTFTNLAENERIGRTLASSFALVLNPTLEELNDFKTAVSEAVTNAIIHAYPESVGTVTMKLERDKNTVRVTVSDQGVGISDIRKSMEPLYTTIRSGERSGMGFTFMEAFSDELLVHSRPGLGTEVQLVKKMGEDMGWEALRESDL